MRIYSGFIVLKIKLSQVKLVVVATSRPELAVLTNGKSLPVTRTRKSNYQTKVGQERRRHIIESTRKLLEFRNANEITLKHIADHADIPLTSIYNLFKNLDFIYSEIVKEIWDELTAFRKRNLKTSYSDFCEMVEHSTKINIAFIRENVLVKQIIYSQDVPAAITAADQALLLQAIKDFVSNYFCNENEIDLDEYIEKIRKSIICFDALVLDCVSRNGNILKSDEDEIVEIMVKLSS